MGFGIWILGFAGFSILVWALGFGLWAAGSGQSRVERCELRLEIRNWEVKREGGKWEL